MHMKEFPQRTAKAESCRTAGEPLTATSSTSPETKNECSEKSEGSEEGQSPLMRQAAADVSSLLSGSSGKTKSGSAAECWICFDSTNSTSAPIVTHRCLCRGSVGYVHQRCIDRWVIQQHNRSCRSCGAAYQLAHSEYPAGVSLPRRPHERRKFLYQFLVKPLLLETAETLCCVFLRFVIVPLLLGHVYSAHRWSLLWWPMRRILPTSASSTATQKESLITSGDVLNTVEVGVDGDGAYTLTASLLAWGDVVIFGLVLCVLMDAVKKGWKKWNDFFQDSRAQHARTAARQVREEAEAPIAVAAAAAGVRAPLDDHENETLLNARRRSENVGGRVENNPLQRPDAAALIPPLFPEDVNERRQVGAQDAAIAVAGGQEARGESDSDDSDSDSDSNMTYRLSFVDQVFEAIDWVKSGAGGGGIKQLLPSLLQQLGDGAVLAMLLRSVWGRAALAVAFAVFIVFWPYSHKRNVLKSRRLRLHEVAERIPLLSQKEVRTLFEIYLVDGFFFYLALPVLGGMMLHYAVAPYINVGFDHGFVAFLHGLTALKLTLYWVVGAVLVMLLTAIELTVMGPLFANGVDLFFVRSFDVRWDSVVEYWSCVVTQIFDSDPLRIVRSFLRVALAELVVLLVFVRMPFWGMLACRDLLWGDGTVMETGLPLRMPLSLGMVTRYDINANASLDDWHRGEELRILATQVLLPFGTMYTERLRVRVAPADEPIPHDSIDRLLLVAANSTSSIPTAQELWKEVWGSMSERSVFLFNLIDPVSVKRVAAVSEGFRRTMERVQGPMDWLRVATSEDGICNTLIALSSSVHRLSQTESQLPLIDMAAIVTPPALSSKQEADLSPDAHQAVLDAWRHTYEEATHRILNVLQLEAMPTLSSPFSEQGAAQVELDTMSAVKCYIATMQLSYPYFGLSRWRAIAYEWWSLLLLRNTYVNYFIDLVAHVAALCTILSCFFVYPLQRAQLRFLFPLVRWIGHNIVRMEDYLFDPDHVRAVENFLEQDIDDELFLPPTIEPKGLGRREQYMEEADIPSYLMLRRMVMAVLFFIISSLMVWVVPVLGGTFIMCFTKRALPVFLGAISFSFFIWSPSFFGHSVVCGMAVTVGVLFAVPILLFMYIGPFVELFWNSYPTLVQETFERQYNVHQTVGPFRKSRSRGSSYADVDSEDSWESVDSSDADD